jgi:hypothetical protein
MAGGGGQKAPLLLLLLLMLLMLLVIKMHLLVGLACFQCSNALACLYQIQQLLCVLWCDVLHVYVC